MEGKADPAAAHAAPPQVYDIKEKAWQSNNGEDGRPPEGVHGAPTYQSWINIVQAQHLLGHDLRRDCIGPKIREELRMLDYSYRSGRDTQPEPYPANHPLEGQTPLAAELDAVRGAAGLDLIPLRTRRGGNSLVSAVARALTGGEVRRRPTQEGPCFSFSC